MTETVTPITPKEEREAVGDVADYIESHAAKPGVRKSPDDWTVGDASTPYIGSRRTLRQLLKEKDEEIERLRKELFPEPRCKRCGHTANDGDGEGFPMYEPNRER